MCARLPELNHAAQRADAARIALLAVRSLHAELALYPKPGLVSFVDSGSHADMDARTFMRSLFTLRGYFRRMAEAGMRGEAFHALREGGVRAETRMLAATRGINTHRGAIFCIGLLCAAIGACRATGLAVTAPAIRGMLRARYGPALDAHRYAGVVAASHGGRVMQLHGATGAREEAARGLPAVFEVALPALQATLAAGRGPVCARIDAFFALMAHISDTNIYHRGGVAGAAFVRQRAQRFLAQGGTAHPAWRSHAVRCHEEFVARRLSPGGAADLLAATLLVDAAAAGFAAAA